MHAALLAALLSVSPAARAAAPAPTCTAAPAPDGPLRTITPDQIPALVAEKRGCVVLLEVYASWCGTCTRTAPEVEALIARLRPGGLSTVGLSVDTSTERLLAWRQTHGRTFDPVVVEGWTLDSLTTIFAGMGASFQEAIPLLVLLDAEGRVVLSLTEPKSLDALETTARKLLAAP